jgi:hypothetical protein
MARHIPQSFQEKVRRVRLAVDVALGVDRRHYSLTGEVEPGVTIVASEVGGQPVAFTLWTYQRDIAELCGDAAYPATAALLAIDGDQAREAGRRGVTVDLSQLTRSESYPGVYYALLDHASKAQVRAVLRRLMPALGAGGIAA